MIRDEESWFKSLKNQMNETNKEAYSLKNVYATFSNPTFRQFLRFIEKKLMMSKEIAEKILWCSLYI